MMEHDLSVAPGRTHQYYTGTPVIPFGTVFQHDRAAH